MGCILPPSSGAMLPNLACLFLFSFSLGFFCRYVDVGFYDSKVGLGVGI
jgi:hypothetical protein